MSRTTTAPSATQTSKASQTPAMQQAAVPLEKVAMLAYQKWVTAGCNHGCDKQHWFEAEAELKSQTSRTAAPAKK